MALKKVVKPEVVLPALDAALNFISGAPDAQKPAPASEPVIEPTHAPAEKAPKKPRKQGKVGNRFVRGNKEYISMAFVPGTLDKIDAAAKKMGLSRTAWLTVVIGQILDGQ